MPLYDLDVAGRRIFWVAACAGIIVFGSLMGAMFIGQQYLQNVLALLDGRGRRRDPARRHPAWCITAPRSAKLVEAHGARFTLLTGYVFCLLGFITMLLLWNEGSSYWVVGLGYAFVGAGVGFAGTPASHSLTGSVPVSRAGMASGTADLQRDLGGAIMQSILGALLTAGYASAVAASIADAPNSDEITDSVQTQLQRVVRRRGVRRRAVPAVRRADHGGGEVVVPRRRRLGVRRGDRRHPAGRHDRVHHVPPPGGGAGAAGQVPRGGHRDGRRAGAAGSEPAHLTSAGSRLGPHGHVRGDVLYGFFTPRVQATIDLTLYILFFIPGVIALVWAGYYYAADSWRINEHSNITAEGPPIYPFKTVIPIAGAMLLVQGIVEIVRCVICIKQGEWPSRQQDVEEVDVDKLKEMVHVKDEDIHEARRARRAAGARHSEDPHASCGSASR